MDFKKQTGKIEDYLFLRDIASTEVPIDPKLKEAGITLNRPKKQCDFEVNDPIPKNMAMEVIRESVKFVNNEFDPKVELLPSRELIKNFGQKFALISYCGPNQDQKSRDGSLGMKIWGMFKTQEELIAHMEKIKTINKQNNDYTFLMIDMYRWALAFPTLGIEQTEEERDAKIIKLLKDHMILKIKSRDLFNLRKDLLIGKKKVTSELPEKLQDDYIPDPLINGPEKKKEEERPKTLDICNENSSSNSPESEGIKIPNQEFAIFSLASPFSKDCVENESMAIKFWGAFPDYATAQKMSDVINQKKECEFFETIVVQMYELMKLPIDLEEISNKFVSTTNKQLNEMIDGYNSETNKVDTIFDERKIRSADPTEKISSLKELAKSDPTIEENNKIASELIMPTLQLPELESHPVEEKDIN